MSIKVKIKLLHKDAIIPKYFSETAACFDLVICEDITIPPLRRAITGLGFTVQPENSEVVMEIMSRSGITLKNGLIVLNAPGQIDSDYTGEVKLILYNSDPRKTIRVYKGFRVAQGRFTRIDKTIFEETTEVQETERGEGGFGSSGTIIQKL